MGYTETAEMNRDLTGEEFEDITVDVMRIVEVAQEQGIALCSDDFFDSGPVVVDSELICLNGVGEQSAEALQVWRRIPIHPDHYQPTLNFCKTYRRNYTPVVQAVLMTLKQRAPNDVMISSNGEWGYEWLHGPLCCRSDSALDYDECLNKDPEHVQMGGRELYRLAFPDSPEPMYPFQSPLVGSAMDAQYLYVPHGIPLVRRGSGSEGAAFGVTIDFLIDQSKRRSERVCMICGEVCESAIKTVRVQHAPWKLNGPMCEGCYREGVKDGKLFGYRPLRNRYRLVGGTR